MGVRVDEAGQHDLATGVERRLIGMGEAQLGGRAHRSDLLAVDQHGAVWDDPQSAQVKPALQAAGEGQELGGGVEEHLGQ